MSVLHPSILDRAYGRAEAAPAASDEASHIERLSAFALSL
jgi:hypothetical protein